MKLRDLFAGKYENVQGYQFINGHFIIVGTYSGKKIYDSEKDDRKVFDKYLDREVFEIEVNDTFTENGHYALVIYINEYFGAKMTIQEALNTLRDDTYVNVYYTITKDKIQPHSCNEGSTFWLFSITMEKFRQCYKEGDFSDEDEDGCYVYDVIPTEMKTLRVNDKTFRYEKLVDGEDDSNFAYSLYDNNGKYIASAIKNFTGVRKIAKAYLTGDEDKLYQAINEYCF
jgi:hypothetical protein